MNASRNPPKREQGFTLVEMMISVALTGIVATSAYLLLNTVSLDANMVEARTQAAEENRHAIETMTTELRQAVELVEGYGAFDPTVYSPTACAFYSDVDRDGAPEKVKYYLLSGKLMKSLYQNVGQFPPYAFSGTPDAGYPKAVCSSVSNSDVFRYVDGQDPPVDVPAANSRDAAVVILHIVDTVFVGGDSGLSDITTWVKIRSINNTIL